MIIFKYLSMTRFEPWITGITCITGLPLRSKPLTACKELCRDEGLLKSDTLPQAISSKKHVVASSDFRAFSLEGFHQFLRHKMIFRIGSET